MKQKRLILDVGNALVKWRTGSGEGSFRSAHAILADHQYENITSRPSYSGQYMRINGLPVVFGEQAERHNLQTKKQGAARYSPDYYGLYVAAALADAYPSGGGEIFVYASYPPGHYPHRAALLRAALGTYEIETIHGKRVYRVVEGNAFDEPLGGVMNLILNEAGNAYQRSDINAGDNLVIDIGGYTTDLLSIRRGGEIDYALMTSIPLGVNQIINDAMNSIAAAYPDLSRRTGGTLPIERVRAAIETHEFRASGRAYNVEDLIDEAVFQLINSFAGIYQAQAQGGLPYDNIILTGGGAVMLYDHLVPVLDHGSIVLAEDRDAIHLANVRGGAKLLNMYQLNGAF